MSHVLLWTIFVPLYSETENLILYNVNKLMPLLVQRYHLCGVGHIRALTAQDLVLFSEPEQSVNWLQEQLVLKSFQILKIVF